jgi:hypothetical protein
MPDRDDEIAAEEHVHLAVPHVARLAWLGIFDLRRAHDDEERVVIALNFRALMCGKRVFNGQIVEAELFLNLPQERLVRLVEANPHERVGALEHIADIVEGDLADLPPSGVGHTRDDGAGHLSRNSHGSL